MALSKRQRFNRKAERSMVELQKLSMKEALKLSRKAFGLLNNKATYKYWEKQEHNSYHNLLDFLCVFDIFLKKKFGKKKKYGKEDTEEGFFFLFPEPTKRQVKTFNHLKKVFKKTENEDILGFPFKFGEKTVYEEPSDDGWEIEYI